MDAGQWLRKTVGAPSFSSVKRRRAIPATSAAAPLGATTGVAEDRRLGDWDSRSVEAALLRDPGPAQEAGAEAEDAAEWAGHPEAGERPPEARAQREGRADLVEEHPLLAARQSRQQHVI